MSVVEIAQRCRGFASFDQIHSIVPEAAEADLVKQGPSVSGSTENP